MLRTFFSYYGAKWRVAPHYPPPEYDTIIEPFAGAAGYSLRYPDRSVILIDKDPNITETWRYLLKVKPEEILALPDFRSGQTVDDLRVCDEAKLLIGWWSGAASVAPRKAPSAWMRSSVGGPRAGYFWGGNVRERIAGQLEYIRHWQVSEGDYRAAPNITATWFVDPPYQLKGRGYRCSAKDIDYTGLASWCQGRAGQVMVCENVGATWLPFSPWRRVQSSTNKGAKYSQEALWVKPTKRIKIY